ncbi:MAG: hypothetical protein IPO95_11100 [Rhodanobacteraceae bacterium]|nr:hypothetical protein [Rhodanobacteraceae bacterium]MBP6077201.1 hypothetical protein [Xanthomonadales bacterium]
MNRFPEFVRAALRRFVTVSALATLALPTLVCAQLPDPLPTPNIDLWTNGSVTAIARAADGSVVFGGYFLAVNGVKRNHIARLLPNGTLDPDWNPMANSSIHAIAIDSDGAIFVGGFFTEIGGLPRERIAKLSASGNGLADPDWNPGANASVEALALDGKGTIYVGGTFTMIAGEARGRLAKLATSGPALVDPLWDPNVGGNVLALAHDAVADALFVSGDFSAVSATPRASLAKVAASGLGNVALDWNPGSDGIVTSLQLDGLGSLYAGGSFGSFASQPHLRLARVDTITGVGDAAWSPSINGGDVYSIALDGSHIYVGGSFTEVTGVLQPRLARVSTVDGTADTSFDPQLNAAVHRVASFGNGIVYLGGTQLTDINDEVRLGFALLDASGSVLAAIDVLHPGSVYALTRLPGNGGMLVGGNFYFANASSRRNLLKLDSNGLLDPTWIPRTDGAVFGLTLDAPGSAVYATGAFLNVNGVSRPSLAKIATGDVGAIDAGWNPAPGGGVETVAVAADGAVFVGGSFTQIAGFARDRIARVSAQTALLDTSWNAAGADGPVKTLGIAPDGSLFASGPFSTINGAAREGFARIDPLSGVVNAAWSADLDSTRFARSMVFANDAIYIGGGFTTVAGVPRTSLAKVSIASPAVVDPVWNPLPDAEVEVLVLGADDRLFVAGGFTMIDGQNRQYVAKLSTLDSGTLDSTWAPTIPGSYVGAMALDATGNLVIGGYFQHVGTQPRQSIAALPQVVPPPIALFSDSFE